jgi:hypothetical protein
VEREIEETEIALKKKTEELNATDFANSAKYQKITEEFSKLAGKVRPVNGSLGRVADAA